MSFFLCGRLDDFDHSYGKGSGSFLSIGGITKVRFNILNKVHALIAIFILLDPKYTNPYATLLRHWYERHRHLEVTIFDTELISFKHRSLDPMAIGSLDLKLYNFLRNWDRISLLLCLDADGASH